MKFNVKVIRERTELRKEPRYSSPIIFTIPEPDDMILTTTKLYQGWFYIEEYKAWAEYLDLMLVEIIEPFNEKEDGFSSDTQIIDDYNSKLYDGDAVILAINKANKFINANKVAFVDIETGEQTGIYTLLTEIKNDNETTKELIETMKEIPDIPKVSEDSAGKILKINSDNKTEWGAIDFDDIQNKPEDSEVYTNDF